MTGDEMIKGLRYKAANIKAHMEPEFFAETANLLSEETDRLSRIKSIIKAYDEGCSSEFAAINSIRRVVSE
jgi:hypothetical protein